MTALLYNSLYFIGLLCCLHGRTNGYSYLEQYSLENTENSFNNYAYGRFDAFLWSPDIVYHCTRFWNKLSDFFNYKLKVLEIFISNINWYNNDEIQNQNASSMHAKKFFFNYANRKIEKNIPRRIPREIIKTLMNNNVIQQSATFSREPFISMKEIKNQSNLNHSLTTYPTSTINTSRSSINLMSTLIPLNISIDTSVISSKMNSIPMTSSDIPLISSIAVNDMNIFQNNITNKDNIKIFSDVLPDKSVNGSQTFQNNITKKDEIKIFPDILPDNRNYFFIGVIVVNFLSTAFILVIGIFITYKKYLETGRCAHDIVHVETPV